MSFFDYQASRQLAAMDAPFDALIMAAMRRADSINAAKLRGMWPDVWLELQARYDAPGGLLTNEREA